MYWRYNTHCIYDMAPTIFMAQYALYMTSHTRFMTSQHSIHYIILLYLISNWLYLTAHQLYLCHHTQIIDHITPIVCMITQAQYIWYYMNTYGITFLFMISHHGMTFTHTVFMSSHPGYLSLHPLQLSYYLQCIEYTTSAVCVISNPLYVWHHMNSMWYLNNS